MNHNVEIKQLDELTIAAMDHKGDYMQIGGTFEKAFAYAGQNGLLNETTRSFGIYYDDPSEVAIDELRSQAGFTVTNDFSDTDDIKKTTILGGKYGVLTHRGPYANLEGIYEWLYSAWIADSGEEPRDQPCIEEYVNDPRTTPESELETIIYIPLK